MKIVLTKRQYDRLVEILDETVTDMKAGFYPEPGEPGDDKHQFVKDINVLLQTLYRFNPVSKNRKENL